VLGPYDVIVDCTDRPYTRYLLNDATVLLAKTLVSGAAIAGAGQWATYGGTSSAGTRRACYRCMWPRIVGEGGGKCDEVGVWGPVVGMVGVAMAGEVLRVIIGSAGKWEALARPSVVCRHGLTGRRTTNATSLPPRRIPARAEREDESTFDKVYCLWATEDDHRFDRVRLRRLLLWLDSGRPSARCGPGQREGECLHRFVSNTADHTGIRRAGCRASYRSFTHRYTPFRRIWHLLLARIYQCVL